MSTKKASFLSIGGSIFSMFFGAGNILFPLILGSSKLDSPVWAFIGMFLTSVLVPLLGIISIVLFSGNYKKFFSLIGEKEGFVIICFILALIGPFGGIPRAITVSQSTLSEMYSSICFINKPVIFNLISCILIFIFSVRIGAIINWLGNIFFPIMMISIMIISIKGLLLPTNSSLEMASSSSFTSFKSGYFMGLNTMDLLASFFFSSIVLLSLKYINKKSNDKEDACDQTFHINWPTIKLLLKGSIFSSTCLGVVYLSFIFLARKHSNLFLGVNPENLFGNMANIMLKDFKIIAALGVFFSCLTTEIALVGIFSDFLKNSLFKGKIPYRIALLISLVIAFFMSILNFQRLCSWLLLFLKPIYPALIALSISSIFYKILNFKHTKLVFYSTLVFTLFYSIIHRSIL